MGYRTNGRGLERETYREIRIDRRAIHRARRYLALVNDSETEHDLTGYVEATRTSSNRIDVALAADEPMIVEHADVRDHWRLADEWLRDVTKRWRELADAGATSELVQSGQTKPDTVEHEVTNAAADHEVARTECGLLASRE